MPKICIYASALTRGGTERVITNLAAYLKTSGWDVVLVTIYKKENEYPLAEGIRRILSDLTPEETVKGSNPAARALNFWGRKRKLHRIFKMERPDIILSFIGKNNMMALETARTLKIPVVVCVRANPENEYPEGSLRSWMLRTFPMAAGIVCTTQQCCDFFQADIHGRTKVLPNPLNPAFLVPPYEGEREKKVVAVGRLDDNKNHLMMIRAFARVLKDGSSDLAGLKRRGKDSAKIPVAPTYDDWTFHIYGDGPNREKLLEEIRTLGMEGKVVLEGSVTDVAGAIRTASVFLLTSDTEGMPNSMLEAMALGIAPIATNCPCGGPADVIRSGENGLLIPVQGKEVLYEDLKRLMSDAEYCRELGTRAVSVRETYAPDKALPAWDEYLRSFVRK